MGLLSSFTILLTMGVATRGQILKDSSKYLFFRDSATVYSCYPVTSLVGFSDDAGSDTSLIVYFLPQDSLLSGRYDFVALTVTDHETAIRDIMAAINFSKKPVITIADDLNSDYVAASISATDGMNATTNLDQT